MRERSVALQRFAYLVTRNREDAQDAVQDALLGLYPRWDKVAARGGVDAYVHRSVVNAAISRWRRARRFVPVEDPAEVAPVSERLLEDELVDADVAWKLCGELPPDQRAAVVLRYYEDYSYARIAAVLGCREATARSHVHRAMTTLRARLVGDDHD